MNVCNFIIWDKRKILSNKPNNYKIIKQCQICPFFFKYIRFILNFANVNTTNLLIIIIKGIVCILIHRWRHESSQARPLLQIFVLNNIWYSWWRNYSCRKPKFSIEMLFQQYQQVNEELNWNFMIFFVLMRHFFEILDFQTMICIEHEIQDLNILYPESTRI